MLAVTKASLKATFRSPQSIFFSLFFPVVLIWIFGSLGGSGTPSVDVAFDKNADSANILYQTIHSNPVLHIVNDPKKDIEDELRKGRITAIINIQRSNDSGNKPPYNIHLKTSSAGKKDLALFQTVLNSIITKVNSYTYPETQTVASISETEIKGRQYNMIDFFLPGMIGFSLIGSAVFGVAFLFYSLRETLVLKRMYSTPIRREYIILGESLSKVVFQLITVVVLIAFGYFSFHFYLAHGWITFINMLLLSILALLVFMGFGFFISGISKNQNVIPIYANLFMFPQYFLSGTFFSKNALPDFLQPVIKFLPLTAVNDAMRNVAFEGTTLYSCWPQIIILIVWGILIYTITAKTFRWE
ncbi:MAG TPA: ABC transporter permease [Flavisolibacter sp.]|jgi:ABC-2 type transport system permease protein|nr:ABC transporter permease [Flavisolibacter sp.]